MKILFWNLAKHNLSKYIKEILAEQDIDVAIFAEHSGVDFRMLCEKVLNGKYVFIEGYGNCEKIRLIAKSSIKVSVCREDIRYSISSVSILDQKYIVAGVHLPAKPYASQSDREIHIAALASHLHNIRIALVYTCIIPRVTISMFKIGFSQKGWTFSPRVVPDFFQERLFLFWTNSNIGGFADDRNTSALTQYSFQSLPVFGAENECRRYVESAQF